MYCIVCIVCIVCVRAQFEDLFVGPFAEAKKFCEDKEAYLKQVWYSMVWYGMVHSVWKGTSNIVREECQDLCMP